MMWTEKTDGFLRHLAAERRSKAYRNNVKAVLQRFGESVGEKDPAEVTKAEVEGWAADLNERLAPSTVGGYLTILKAAMRYWASEDRWSDRETPASVRGLTLAGVREMRVRGTEELLTEEEYRRLLGVMPPDRALIFRLLWDTGARRGEVLNLRKRDVKFLTDGDVEVSFRKTKSGKPRVVPVIERTTIEVLRSRWEMTPPDGYLFPSPTKEGSPLQGPGVWRYLNRVKGRAGIDRPLWPHLFRNTATKRMAGLRGGLRRKMMGWAPGSKMEDRYEVWDTDDLRQGLHELEGTPEESEKETAARALVSISARIAASPDLEKALLEMQELQAQILIRNPVFLKKAEELSALMEKEPGLSESLGFPEGEVDWEAAKAAARRKD